MRNFTKVRLPLICGLTLLFMSCNNPALNTSDNEQSCAEVYTRYSQIVDASTNDSTKVNQLMLFFDSTVDNCSSTSKIILAKLFRFAARNPLDSNLKLFFTSTGNNTSLDARIRAAAYLNRTSCFLFLSNDVDSGLNYLNKAKALEKDFDDTTYRSYYALMAQAMVQKTRYTEAADYYVKAISLSDKIKDSGYSANLYSNFASLFSRISNHRKSLEMKFKPLPYYLSKNDEYELMTQYASISASYALLKVNDSALVYNAKAIEYINKGVNNPYTTFYVFINQAVMYAEMEKFDSANYYFDRAKIKLQDINNPLFEKQFVISSSIVYSQQRDITHEIKKIKTYIPELIAEEDLPNLRDCYETIFRYSISKNQQDSALRYNRLRDSVVNIILQTENKNIVTELETKYQSDKKELQILLQKDEIKQKNTLNILLLSLLAAAALGAAFTVTRLQLKRNTKEAALQQEFTYQLLQNTEEERGRIARDLHDSVSQELLLLKNKAKSGTVDSLVTSIDYLINEIRMIARALHPVMLDQIGLKLSIEHVCNRMMETDQLFISSDIQYQHPLSKNQELQLFRIVQEALNNVVKYANAEAAKVSISESNSNLVVVIQDNGKGFDVQNAITEKKSFGLVSIQQRSKTLGGHANIKSSTAGTIVKIEIPLKNA
jgi:two-component system NarL family sensor kinase